MRPRKKARNEKPKPKRRTKRKADVPAPILDCFVYVLGCRADARTLTYVGWTNDIEKRLSRHNAGTGARTTRGRQWTLLHTEAFATRNEAMSREWHLKRDRVFRKQLASRIPA